MHIRHDFLINVVCSALTNVRACALALALLTLSLAVSAQDIVTIAAVQGDKQQSPFDGKQVTVRGIVTAILKSGFYMQTPDSDADKNPNTSEGIYVYGRDSVGSVSIGDLAEVSGTVKEYAKKEESSIFPTTEISRPAVKVISKNNPLPTPIVLTSADLDPSGKLDQMEKFEGMRVRADIVAVGPTGAFTERKTGVVTSSNGVFYATLQSAPRPFREPGVEVLKTIELKLPKTIPVFDMNPEMLHIASSAQIGAKPLDVTAGATIKGLTGVIQYGANDVLPFGGRDGYTFLVDAANPPAVENMKAFVAVSAAREREVTVGSFNIENFFDDDENSKRITSEAILPKEVFKNRLNKVSLAIRNVLAMPDVLGIIEVENLKVMQKIATKISADAIAAGQPDPKYTAYLEDGNDFRGINVGYLVKSEKIKVLEVKQLAGDVKLNYPGGSAEEKLFDRPPLMLRAEVIDPKAQKPFSFTVIVNHFKSYLGVDDAEKGDRTRNKRRLEAEWLANFIQERQKADASERMLVCGDFNAFQFNDGFNDLIGILKGKPDPNVLVPSKGVFNTGLVDLVDYIGAASRYSYTFDGSAQAIDHILVNKQTRERVLKFGFARVDADFPEIWANDANRPERISDHDAPIVFLSLDEPAPKVPPMTPVQ